MADAKLKLNRNPNCNCCGTESDIRFSLYVVPHYRFLICPVCDKISLPPRDENGKEVATSG